MKDLNIDNFKINDHEIIFAALVGSHNYNLSDEHSDKDYKIFVMPTFHDLYYGNACTGQYNSDTIDYSVHDIRKLPKLLFKSNINFLEVLFSKEYIINSRYEGFMNLLLNDKEQYAAMNLPYLYRSCKGMSYEKLSRLAKYTDGTKYLEQRDGYNTKEACHALRVLETLLCYKECKSFEKSLRFNGYNFIKNTLHDIKAGKFTEEEFQKIFDNCLKEFNNMKFCFTASANEVLYDKLLNFIYETCHSIILNEDGEYHGKIISKTTVKTRSRKMSGCVGENNKR